MKSGGRLFLALLICLGLCQSYAQAEENPWKPVEAVHKSYSTTGKDGNVYSWDRTMVTYANSQTGETMTLGRDVIKANGVVVSDIPIQAASVPINNGGSIEGHFIVVNPGGGAPEAPRPPAVDEQARQDLKNLIYPKGVPSGFPLPLPPPSQNLGQILTDQERAKQFQDTVNRDMQWARERQKDFENELGNRDAAVQKFVDSGHQRAAAIVRDTEVASKYIGMELATQVSMLQAASKTNLDAIAALREFEDPMANIESHVVMSEKTFKDSVARYDQLLKKGDVNSAVLAINELIGDNVAVEGNATKQALLGARVDNQGRAFLGSSKFVLGEKFATTDVGARTQIVKIANIYQAAALKSSSTLMNKPGMGKIFLAGAMQLRMADQSTDALARETMTNAARTLGYFAAGMLVGAGWSVYDAGKGVLKIAKGVFENIDVAMGDDRYCSKLLASALDGVSVSVQPALQNVAIDYAKQLTHRPSFQAGMIAGRVVTDVAIAFIALSNPATWIGVVGVMGKVGVAYGAAGNVVKDVAYMVREIRDPNLLFNPLMNSLSVDPVSETLAQDTTLGLWFTKKLNEQRK